MAQTIDLERAVETTAGDRASNAGEHVAILGGTGRQGSGLALRWARAGYTVLIGSRSADKAERVAADLNEKLGADLLSGLSNAEAARQSDVAVLTVPFSAHRETLEALRGVLEGKVLVDVTVPQLQPGSTRVHLPEQGAAALQAQQILGEGVRVISALQNVSQHFLSDPERSIECDVLVCGADAEAKAQVIELSRALGPAVRAFDGGPLENAVAAEALTPVLIHLGKQFRRLRVGIRITGIDR